ncbi:MAG: hypothetical protein ABUS79_09770 [Pseudomonadota bacterium]
MNVLRTPAAALFAFTLCLAGCGGSDKADPVALCKQGCSKGISLCFADAGAFGATAQAACESNCTSQSTTGGKPCANSNAQIAAYKVCQAKTTCDELTACAATIPACEGGGSSGTGGASGSTGGASGSTGGASGTGGRAGGSTGGASGTGGRAGGSTGGAGGAAGGGECAALLACCNASTNPTVKSLCMTQYSSVMAMGDAVCGQVLTTVKPSVCP